MKHLFRYLISFAISFVLVLISGYRNLASDISESLAVTSFFGAVIVISLILFVLIEMYVKIKRLSKRISELEKKFNEKNSD